MGAESSGVSLQPLDDSFPVPQETIEAGLLVSIAEDTNRWVEVSAFDSEDFIAHRSVFQWIGQYLQQYGALPSNSLLNTKFDLHAPIGDYQYWITEFRRYSLARRAMDVLQEGYSKRSNPEEMIRLVIDKLSLIRSQQTNHIKASDFSAMERLERFDWRTEHAFINKEILGLRTGMKIIDETMEGWTPGSLVGLYSRPSVGKTWWLMWQGVLAWVEGKTVLSIATEVPANQLGMRMDLLVAQLLGHPLDYSKLRVGDPSVRPNYELVAQILSQTKRWWTYDSYDDNTIGLGDLAALVRQHNPDVVLIDGISLLKSSSRGQMWEQMKDLCYGAKQLATRYEVPILMTHQAVNSNRGNRKEITALGRGDDFHMPNLNDAAFGDSFVAACSDVITMCGEPHSSNIVWYSLRKFRERGFQQELPGRMALIKDFGRGIIHDASELGYNIDAVDQERRRVLGL